MFTHDAVVDHVQCGANEVEATQVTFEIKKLSERNRKGQTGFEQKFKVGRHIFVHFTLSFLRTKCWNEDQSWDYE